MVNPSASIFNCLYILPLPVHFPSQDFVTVKVPHNIIIYTVVLGVSKFFLMLVTILQIVFLDISTQE